MSSVCATALRWPMVEPGARRAPKAADDANDSSMRDDRDAGGGDHDGPAHAAASS